ncbi:phage T7 capsid assembly family protein [Rickettsia amblyommatis str. Ac/Pa]|uniref:Phage T7 capsid assembly family protein n=2 Tax=Rickettsia amblyommatis TaxID=33989 RepID=A0A0F3N4P5_RICAM|nr:phage T7 capsid assembly family protein [Rickettsia amblyommatis str. Ac/Pa]
MTNENPDIQEIKTLADLPSGTGSEYFINAHGSEFFYKPTNLGLWGKIKSYFMSEPSYLSMSIFSDKGTTSVLDITLLNKIQNNTTANQCNIVHIFSCHSGAAQHHLDWVQGNMVLCTYNKASDANIIRLAQNNYDARTKNDSLLIEYVRDNFHLLVASDFSISYKLDDQIYSFSLSANKIKNMKSIVELPAFLHKEYKAFVKFYKNIHSEYHESYPEIFNLNIETKPKELTYADLIRVFSRALTLETYNFNKFSLSKIETMLNQKGLYTDTSIGHAIEQGNSELLICLLNYGNTKINSYNLDKAIEKGDLAILKAVLEHSTTKIELYNLNKAIEKGDLAILKAVLEHSTTKIELYNLNKAIEKGDLAILKAVLEHSTTKIELYNLNKAIEKGDLAILKAVLEHSTTKIELYNLNKAIEKGDLAILKAVLEHTTIEVSSYNIYKAEETHNLDVIELVKKYYNSTINTITSEENTIDTTLTVVEEVPVLGEGTEGV